MRIWTVGLENVPGIVGLSDALFREADGCRDPATNLEGALQEGRGRVVRRAPSRRCGRLLAGGASSRWGCHRVPGGPPVRSGLPSDGEGGDAGEHVCPRGSGDTAREPSDIGGRLGEISAPTLSSAGAEIASTRPIFSLLPDRSFPGDGRKHPERTPHHLRRPRTRGHPRRPALRQGRRRPSTPTRVLLQLVVDSHFRGNEVYGRGLGVPKEP